MEIELEDCKPESTLEEQLVVIQGEVKEVSDAIKKYRCEPNGKTRAEVLFELLDVVNATFTAIAMEFNDDEVEAGVQYTNGKTYVRGYRKDICE